jgi:adenosylmethionine-8-amino-7-oxononanoate aminotransferase
MIGVELRHNTGLGRLYTQAEALAVREQFKEVGVLTYHFANGISLFPAMTMQEDELRKVLEVMADVLTVN